eukprot:CAMPEP_0113942662 /NCGR_PEP_ID=MMETSP1339-20121228/8326_1 /TAXON_ID=94617 /ORGANISM="Fibrocapsa japonica" /LENGTH=137 /DNA_ID=CAMNT_0000947199 /DNA_START=98 /DNA_END=507 /DNA_ORIENTATION=- /assembly_acc=CAM_ASM_000762
MCSLPTTSLAPNTIIMNFHHSAHPSTAPFGILWPLAWAPVGVQRVPSTNLLPTAVFPEPGDPHPKVGKLPWGGVVGQPLVLVLAGDSQQLGSVLLAGQCGRGLIHAVLEEFVTVPGPVLVPCPALGLLGGHVHPNTA